MNGNRIAVVCCDVKYKHVVSDGVGQRGGCMIKDGNESTFNKFTCNSVARKTAYYHLSRSGRDGYEIRWRSIDRTTEF